MKFIRHASHRKAKLKDRWRRPRGLHNKQRLEIKGSTPRVKIGYRSQASQRGKRKGLLVKQVYTLADFDVLDPKVHGIVIGSVGLKKKLVLLEHMQSTDFVLLTGKPQEEITRLQELFSQRRATSKQKILARQKKQQQAKEKAEKTPSEETSAEKETPLSEVKGVGPAKIKLLEAQNIVSAEALSLMDKKELSKVLNVPEASAEKMIVSAKEAVSKSKEDEEKEKVLTKGR